MNILSNLRIFIARKILPGFSIPKNALVIDIGSGDKPFWRADVFVDKLSLGNVQRASSYGSIDIIGLFIDCDVSKLPFKNKVFDFSYCSHVLEHVEDPGAVIKEIVRISKRGYIEVPNGILEMIKPFDSHLWFVFRNSNILTFMRKSMKLHQVLSHNGASYESVIQQIHEPFIRIYWDQRIGYEILNNTTTKDKFRSKIGNIRQELPTNSNPYIILIKVLRVLFHREKNPKDIARTIYKTLNI